MRVKLAKYIQVCIFLFLGISNSSLAKEYKFVSTDSQVQLIELFTSEGCSSCPPADRWFTSLKSNKDLWTRFVPVSFHVDYWDYIGWQDPFASKQYSQRQRRYAKEFKEPTVYTPGVRKGGEEWRSWRLFGNPSKDNAEEVGQLTIEVQDNGQFTAIFSSADYSNDQTLELNIALLGMSLSSEVSRGENRGKLLKHDFVTLALTSNIENQSVVENAFRWSGKLPSSDTPATNKAIAAWVTNNGKQQPVQAVGGELLQTL